MGGCLSSKVGESRSSGSIHGASNTAKVISANGDLRQYTVPLTVSQVLQMEFETKQQQQQQQMEPAPSASSAKLFFVCNSDRLYYDDYIPALDEQHQLQADQIYFVLPTSKLQYPLTASDMAALAVKATLALQKSTNSSSSSKSKKHSSSPSSYFLRNRGNNKSARISPILVDSVNTPSSSSSSSSSDGDYKYENLKTVTTIKRGISNKQPAVSKSGSMRKLQKYSSRRAKMAVRSFRIRLTTIYEEASVLQFY